MLGRAQALNECQLIFLHFVEAEEETLPHDQRLRWLPQTQQLRNPGVCFDRIYTSPYYLLPHREDSWIVAPPKPLLFSTASEKLMIPKTCTT